MNANEMLLRMGDVLADNFKQRQLEGKIDFEGIKFLHQWPTQRSDLERNEKYRVACTAKKPINRAMAHSKWVTRELAKTLVGRALTKFKGRTGKRRSASAFFGIVNLPEFIEPIQRIACENSLEILNGFSETATLKGMSQ